MMEQANIEMEKAKEEMERAKDEMELAKQKMERAKEKIEQATKRLQLAKEEFGDVEVSGRARQAFSIPLVLENICACLDWKSLCQFRQISKLLYRSSLNSWRDLAPSIKFDKLKLAKNEMLSLPPLNDGHEEDYRRGGVNKYENITISSTTFKIDWKETYWIGGHCTTKLHLEFCIFDSLRLLKEVIFGKHMPKLKCLKLTFTKFNFLPASRRAGATTTTAMEENNVNDFQELTSLTSFDVEYSFDINYQKWPFSWVELLSKYPNLKKLRIAQYTFEELRIICFALAELHETGRLLSVTTIDVVERGGNKIFKFPWPLYQSIMEKDGFLPNLNSISFAVSHADHFKTHEIFLKHVADRLKILSISGSFTGKNRSLRLADVMPKLTSITLLAFHLKNLNFLSKTPKLEKLCIVDTRRFEDSHNIIRSTTLLPRGEDNNDDKSCGLAAECIFLKSFAYNQVVNYTHDDISRLQRWMPNLSRLKLHLNDSSFFAVCEKFPKLKRLHICESKVTDYGFTGDKMHESYKDPNDKEDNIRTEYRHLGLAISNNDIPHEYDPDESDDLSETQQNFNISSSSSSSSLLDFSEQPSDEDEVVEMDDDEDMNEHSDSNEEQGEDEEEDVDENVDEHSDINEEQSDEDHYALNCSSNSDGSEKDNSDDKSRKAIERNMMALKVEEVYLQQSVPHIETNNDVTNSADKYNPYNASCLQEMELLVIERCESDFGCSGLVSTVSFRNVLGLLPKLKEVWVEKGVTTISGLRYSMLVGLYRDYEDYTIVRPGFVD